MYHLSMISRQTIGTNWLQNFELIGVEAYRAAVDLQVSEPVLHDSNTSVSRRISYAACKWDGPAGGHPVAFSSILFSFLTPFPTSRPVSMETKRPCDKIHPTSGEPVALFIPSEAAERGFSGDVKLMPVVSLCPCQRQFPNQPVRIAALCILLL